MRMPASVCLACDCSVHYVFIENKLNVPSRFVCLHIVIVSICSSHQSFFCSFVYLVICISVFHRLHLVYIFLLLFGGRVIICLFFVLFVCFA